MKVGWWTYILPISYLGLVDAAWLARFLPPLAAGGALPPTSRLERTRNAALGLVMVAGMVHATTLFDCTSTFGAALETTGFAQSWVMFSPNPLASSFSVEVVGTLADGRKVDLVREGFAEGKLWTAHPHYESWYASRWQDVAWAVRLDYGRAREYGEWCDRRWLAAGRAPLAHLEVLLRSRPTPPPGAPPAAWVESTLWQR